MTGGREVVLASSNSGKIREFDALLSPLGWRVLAQNDLGIEGADEPHRTFVENALAKARHVAQWSGRPALADDSGLCVPSLQGAPGVDSAYYAGPQRRDQDNNQALLRALSGSADRRAFYYCVLVWVMHAVDPTPCIAEGRWFGEILDAPQGTGGFGYDPLFWVPECGKTAAQMTLAEKNTQSHRARAWQSLLPFLQT
ncbi:MAG: RdgB/HAM1 family non-canonical purine NTP pyrophosphatase [Ferrovum sp.]|jgi:XTP/dITP diphosphohydrolase|nr:RdgB/HAM1 family non-canonical purine NTP pyrophosphatase [Ferrovum sp.]NDU90231.1 RdgB/HAM1 family non-canonical purine NTP pyrophosphatase [Ferrovum sp.]